MNILKESAQHKKSESLNRVFSQSVTENFFFFFNRCFTSFFVVWCLHSLQSKSTEDWDIYSLWVSTHSKHFLKDFTGWLFVDWLIGWFFNIALLDNCLWDVLWQIDIRMNTHATVQSVFVFWVISLMGSVCFILLWRGQLSYQFCVTQDICPIGTPMDVHTCFSGDSLFCANFTVINGQTVLIEVT